MANDAEWVPTPDDMRNALVIGDIREALWDPAAQRFVLHMQGPAPRIGSILMVPLSAVMQLTDLFQKSAPLLGPAMIEHGRALEALKRGGKKN